jgi:hypothetical protein
VTVQASAVPQRWPVGESRYVPLALALLAAAMITFAWTGFFGSDDTSYVGAATGWVNEGFGYVGSDHWSLRQTLVLPIAAAFKIFGQNELGLVVPFLLYQLGMVVVVYTIVRKHCDTATAAATGVFLITTPFVATGASLALPDIVESFFCVSSLAFFLASLRARRPAVLLVLAGVAAGFSYLTRETVIFLILTYGVLFLAGFGMPRLRYFWMALGFLIVFGGDVAYYASQTGDPLYRLTVDSRTHLRSITRDMSGSIFDRLLAMVRATEAPEFQGLTGSGNLAVNRFLDPILVVLANQEFMFIYYVATPAVIWLFLIRRRFSPVQRQMMAVLGTAAATWFICLYLQIGMTREARYYIVPTILLDVFLGIAFVELLRRDRKILAYAAAAFLVLTNCAGVYLDNRNPIFAERALRDYVRETGQSVVTDPETARRGMFLYEAAGVSSKISAGRPEPGKLFFHNPRYVLWGMHAPGALQEWLDRLAPYRPQPGWKEVWRRDSGHKLFGRIVAALGLERYLPEGIWRKLDSPNGTVIVYQP